MSSGSSSGILPTSIIRKAVIALSLIFVITAALLVLSLLLQGNLNSILSNPVAWFSGLDPASTFNILLIAAQLLAAVLAIAITVVAIVVELAANRYSHRITALFIREPINIVVMSFFVVATIYSVMIALSLDASVESATMVNAGFFISLLMVTLSLMILLPYFAFVMSFLSPENIVLKIQISGLNSIRNLDNKSLGASKRKLLNVVDELQDIVRRSVELSDRAVEMASINALCDIALSYQRIFSQIDRHKTAWLYVDATVRTDPDFVSLTKAGVARIEEEGIWVEVKILRQYLDLISDSSTRSRDTSYLIAINTRRIAIDSLEYRPGLEVVELCIRCFNSYLRATINSGDARTGYYIMNQYRLLAEELLTLHRTQTVGQIARYLQFYGLLGFRQGLPFLLEVAAEDIGTIVNESIGKEPELLDSLLDRILELDQELKEEHQSASLLGVRRAQIKVAVRLLDAGDEMRVARICADLKQEKTEIVRQAIFELSNEERKEYWEFTDRGVNFSFLDASLRRHLDRLARDIFWE